MDLTPKQLSEVAGISQSHASMILSGSREPSLRIALRIYDELGAQFGILKGVSKDTIEDLRPKVAA